MADLDTDIASIRNDLSELYKDLHAHPELAFAEHRTAAEIARRATALGYEVTTGVGRTGVVARLANGPGPTVLLRADMDALPVREQTGLPYASTATDPASGSPVMHACGHDVHVTCLLGALRMLMQDRSSWSGTLVAVFQPNEELGAGAQAMIDDNFFARFGTPEVVLGQHVMPLPAGMLAVHAGAALAATDAWKVTLYGRGGHGSQPERSIDPVVMAAATVLRLQTVVSREIAGGDTAVVTVGSMRAGTQNNIIPDQAELQINIRTFIPEVRERVLTAVRRIIRAEAQASGAEREPDIEPITTFPIMTNDPAAVDRTAAALRSKFGADNVIDPGPATGSEDVGVFATASGAPLCYWFIGGADPATFAAAQQQGTLAQDVPANHSPFFAPVIEPTLDIGVAALTTAALTWLGPAN
ncbi:amidohydrolase [Nocardia albiluteola]|uniref:amidohydrolase n=1 Tax=Nocardia albiluteola TaxID=2842303 RepID=UPI0027DFBAAC|nr:amidohydrolase [Nocardia albiluteola]